MSQPDALNDIFHRLGSKSEDVRRLATRDLVQVAAGLTQEYTSHDGIKSALLSLYNRVFDFSKGSHYERLGAIQAIDAFVLGTKDDQPDRALQKNIRLYEYSTVMIAAAKVVGNMVEVAGAILGESFFSKEVGQALQALDDSRSEVGRFSGVLVLHQFAHKAGALFYPHVPRVLDKIWTPLRDSRTMVRERASMLLSACLRLVKEREKDPQDMYKRIFEEARSGLQKAGSTDSVLGSLHAVGAMLDNQQLSMSQFYKEVCELTLRYRDSKELLVRKMVISLIPSMATYDTDEFETLYLHRTMAYLLQALQKPTDRDTAYVALGYMALTLGSKMRPFIDDVVRVIKDHLRQRGKKNAPAEGPIFQCLGYLARAVGPMLSRQMHDVLDLMFLCGLSDPLYSSLKDIADHIPPLLRTVQDRLLETISQALTGHAFRPLGAPVKAKGANMHSAPAETQALALHILGTFDFTGHALNEFVRDAVLPYLEHDSPEVRQEAVLAATQLFIHDPICNQTSAHSIGIVNEVLGKLLIVGIADPVSMIRQTVLEHLSEKFDRHLAQAEDIRCLFIALNDEAFRNRELAIGVIGRLALHNPAYVMPPLRKSLINLITELEYSTNTKQKEESAKLLCLLIAAAASLVKSYAPTLLTVLVRTAQSPDNSTVVSAECVKCIGELARVAGEELINSAKSVIDLVIGMLNDHTSPLKRNAALKTLGQLASNTASVVQPYLDHPQLLGVLFRLLRTESDGAVRLETIRTMGMLGALDPFKHKKLIQGGGSGLDDPGAMATGAVGGSGTTAGTGTGAAGPGAVAQGAVADGAGGAGAGPTKVTDIMLLMNTMTPSNEDFYQTVAVHSLVSVLSDPTLKEYHYEAVEAVMLIFRTQRLRCVSFLPQILPAFLHVVRIAGPQRQEVYLKQLANLISIVKQHIRNFLEDVFSLVHDFWNPNSSLQITIIHLVEAVARAVEGEFKAYLPRLLQQILRTFDGDLSAQYLPDRRLSTLLHILKAFYVFGSSIEDYLHLVLPVIVRSFEHPTAPDELRKAALRTTAQLCRKVNFSDHASQIIHPLIRTLANANTDHDADLRAIAMDTLCVLVLQFGPDYAIFIPMVNKVLVEHRISHPAYESLVTKLNNRERLPPDLGPVERFANDPGEMSVAAEQAKLPVNQQQLKAAWDCSGVASKQDWLEWIKRLNTELMRESPSQAIRASRNLADKLPSFAREMFNVAFVSCWTELYDQYQDDLVHNLELAFTNPQVPPDVVNVILNLAEFMEHDEKPLAIESRLLGDYAVIFHAYAKALHYKELEFFVDASGGVVEDLISINQKLQQTDAAWGTLEYAQENMEMTDDVMWYEKLGRWEEALNVWTQRRDRGDSEFGEDRIAHGQLSAFHALGEWEQLADLVQVRWSSATNDEKKIMAPLAAAASWSMNQWDLMDDYIAAMKSDSADRNFFRAILQVHRNQYSQALKSIGRAREKLDPELTSLTSESYGRAYDVIIRVQMLAELEEIIQYKDLADEPHRQATMQKTWNKRLEGCQKDVEVWQRILQLRSLVLSPNEDMDTWIQFVDLCRTSDRITLAEKTLSSLVGDTRVDYDEQQIRAPPPVIFAYHRLAWAKHSREGGENQRNDRISDLVQLRNFTETLAVDIQSRTNSGPAASSQDHLYVEYQKLLARCYVELGQWQMQLRDTAVQHDPRPIIADYEMATQLDPTWYNAWHTWALANFHVITNLEVSAEGLAPAHFTAYIVPAVEGFLKSIALSPGSALQDMLRLLTLWFQYGYFHGVSDAIARGLHMVKVDVWLEVIPQIIARLQTPRPAIQQLIVRLLQDVGRSHPQALVYPLHVASKSDVLARKAVAQSITTKMKEHSTVVVEQAELVSNELIRAAILWHEQWYDGLEEASKHYFAEANIPGMFEVLLPLHEMVERGPETLRETSFVQSFGHELRAARDHLNKYETYGDTQEIQQAWDIYYQIFQRLNRQLKMLNVIELQYVSPNLLAVRDLDLAVPGTYQAGREVIGIGMVLPTFQVISSKQRPRKISMRGRDGKEYMFCLKGHEDLRQDERVMQLFGLVNTLLSADQECAKRHLHVQPFSVTPLSPGAGVLGWVQHSDTLHLLIKNYRESRRILVDIEHRLMQQMAEENYDYLPLLNKVEVFQYALDNTTGQDLYRILWLKSRNSEAWLERRVTYTRSLGVNSMVGYILGLGDRHPSNLLLDQITGKIVHIDFGDCFEIAQQRDKYPEKVPFRLTRMLIHAMEVCGITGTFSRSCEVTMEVLRDNRESLMAVLEAFVYDPLIAWRLTATNQPGGRVNTTQEPEDMQQKKLKANETEILGEGERTGEVKNDRGLQVIDRVRRKLTGRDFKPDQVLDVKEQVEKLVDEATRTENLCVAFVGWCSFW